MNEFKNEYMDFEIEKITTEKFNELYWVGINKTEAIDGIFTKKELKGEIGFSSMNTTYKVYVYHQSNDMVIYEYEADNENELKDVYQEIKDDFNIED